MWSNNISVQQLKKDRITRIVFNACRCRGCRQGKALGNFVLLVIFGEGSGSQEKQRGSQAL